MIQQVKTIAKSIFHLAFPQNCEACNEALVGNEYYVCVACWHNMPKTNFHLQADNAFEKKMWGRTKVERACSYYYFNKDSRVQDMLHALKYEKKKELGIELGRRYGRDLLKSDWIQDIDFIVPIPLAKQKMKSRGFNQSEYIGRGLSEVLNIPLDCDSVVRVKNTRTQTKMNVTERMDNMSGAFELRNQSRFEQKNILLIDDVVTTGATLESCINSLKQNCNCRVNLLTIAIAIN